jgi:Lrp/AsnC family transcriptional regulator, leucine-responsive regulatory protein
MICLLHPAPQREGEGGPNDAFLTPPKWRLALKLTVRVSNFGAIESMMRKMIDLDGFDRRLLALVRENNLEPARVLAEKVGLSLSAVLRRLRRLRDEKIIVADIAVVNPALTGSALTMHVLVQMQQAGPQTMDNFARAIGQHPEITAAWDVTGVDDFLLKVQVGTMEEYDAFTRRALGEDKGVHSFTTLIAIRNIVENEVARRPLRDR